MSTRMHLRRQPSFRKAPPWSWAAAALLVMAGPVLMCSTALAQERVDAQTLAQLRMQYYEQHQVGADSGPLTLREATFMGEVAPVRGGFGDGETGTAAPVDMYKGLPQLLWFYYGLQPWYYALDDGKMGMPALGVGGGRVTALQFDWVLHADFPGDRLQPYLVLSFWNAPPDPVGGASNPVVDPLQAVTSIGVLFQVITLPNQGFYHYRCTLIDLIPYGLEFDLDETFYIEIIPFKWVDGRPVVDANVLAGFSYNESTPTLGSNQDRMWSDFWVRQNGCNVPGNLVYGNKDGKYQHPAERDQGGCGPWFNLSGYRLVGVECPSTNVLELRTKQPEDVCVKPGETVTVTLSQKCLPGLVRGYQAFLAFDTNALTFDSGSYVLPLPFGLPIITPIQAVGPNIDLAAGINDAGGQLPTTSSAPLVTLKFTAGANEGLTRVQFREHDPPTQFADAFGQPVTPVTLDSPNICVDGTPPVIVCPPNLTPQCMSGIPAPATNYAEFVAQGGTASDSGCGGSVTVKHMGDANNGGAGCPSSPYIVTRTYRATDCAGNFDECVQTVTVVDDTPPVLVNVPADRTVDADVGRCTATLDPRLTPPTATDNCTANPLVEYKRSDRNWNEGLTDPYPAGITTITWKATDDCGNSDVKTTRITVNAINYLLVDVELQPVFAPGPVTRCITFEFWKCPASGPEAIVSRELTFTNGLAKDVLLAIPCGAYTCVTARDKLHTLRRTDEGFGIVGQRYVADFTGDPAPPTLGDWLIGGNLNDDKWIDILDFGIYSYQYVANPTPGANTTCSTVGPHADISGNGIVFTEDFTFIRNNFLLQHEANCCGQPDEGDEGPVVRISVAELQRRGLGQLAAGDLNGDGWLTAEDVAAFLNGARPRRPAADLDDDPRRATGEPHAPAERE